MIARSRSLRCRLNLNRTSRPPPHPTFPAQPPLPSLLDRHFAPSTPPTTTSRPPQLSTTRTVSTTTTTAAAAAAAAAAARQPVRIRLAQPRDAAAIAALGAHVFAATFGHSVPPGELRAYLDAEYTTASITQDLHNPQKDTFVATHASGKMLGFAMLARGTSEACVDGLEGRIELQRLYVDTEAQGSGVGGRLARAAEGMARGRGCRNVWLGVWEENAVARRAYERWGYERVGSHDFVVGTVVQTDWIMVKAL